MKRRESLKLLIIEDDQCIVKIDTNIKRNIE